MSVVFIMLNPSIANADQSDPTVTKCIGFRSRLPNPPVFGVYDATFSACGRRRIVLRRPGFVVVNLFDWVSTKPAGLLEAHLAGHNIASSDWDLCRFIGDDSSAVTVIAAWGGPHGTKPLQRLIKARAHEVAQLVHGMGHKLWCFGVTKDGHPRHPLMLAYDTPLVQFEMRK